MWEKTLYIRFNIYSVVTKQFGYIREIIFILFTL